MSSEYTGTLFLLGAFSLADDENSQSETGKSDSGLVLAWARPSVMQSGTTFTGFANTARAYMDMHKQITLSICDTVKQKNNVRFKWTMEKVVQTTNEDGNTTTSYNQVDTVTTSTCQISWKAPTEDMYLFSIDVIKNGDVIDHAYAYVTIKDLWFVVMGDSFIAGQGCPDAKAGLLGIIPAKWIDRTCYRSGQSFGYHVYQQIADAYPGRGILFTYLACSGASIVPGMLTSYLSNKAQVDVVKDIQEAAKSKCNCAECSCKTVPDAVLISIGGNDAKFSDVIVSLITGNPSDQLSAMPQRLQALKDRISLMAKKFSDLELVPESVFYCQYYDVLKDSTGVANANCPGVGAASSTTFDLAETQIRGPVNDAIQDACNENGWTYVDSMDDVFGTHGVCSREPYINTVGESINLQSDVAGAFHPNYKGHEATAGVVWSKVQAYLEQQG